MMSPDPTSLWLSLGKSGCCLQGCPQMLGLMIKMMANVCNFYACSCSFGLDHLLKHRLAVLFVKYSTVLPLKDSKGS